MNVLLYDGADDELAKMMFAMFWCFAMFCNAWCKISLASVSAGNVITIPNKVGPFLPASLLAFTKGRANQGLTAFVKF